MLRNTKEPAALDKGVYEKISTFNSEVLWQVAYEKVINVHKYINTMRSKVSNNWVNQFYKGKNCIAYTQN